MNKGKYKLKLLLNIIIIFSLLSQNITFAAEPGSLAPEQGWIHDIFHRDSQTAGLLWDLFKWARRSTNPITLDSLTDWFTKNRLNLAQTNGVIEIPVNLHVLTIDTDTRDNSGTPLPNSSYRIHIKENNQTAILFNAIETALIRYSNVHRGMGQHSKISTQLFDKAREIVAEYLDIDPDEYIVIFGTDLERIKKNLTIETDIKIVDPEISALFGITAVAVRKDSLTKGAPFEKGGGNVALVTEDGEVWAGAPDKFEVGTPNIIGVIGLAKALSIGLKAPQGYKTIKTIDSILDDIFGRDPEESSIDSLSNSLLGKDAKVPTRDTEVTYVNFDNGASTPAFNLVFNAYKKSLLQPEDVKQRLVEKSRDICSSFFQAPQEEYDIIFTKNTSEGINLLAHNLEFPKGSVVLNTFLEHNSNELPWRYIKGVKQERLNINENGFLNLEELENRLRRGNVKLVSVNGASNVLGTVNDLKEIIRISHKYGAKVLVDAAQLTSHKEIRMHEWGIDFLAFSGHKAYAPFGAGAVIARRGELKQRIKDIDNAAGITAMARALLMLQRLGMDKVAEHEKELTQYAIERLKKIPGIKIYGTTSPDDMDKRVGVISFNINDLPHSLVAEILAEEDGIGVRSGCFCAHLLIQRKLGIGREVINKTKAEIEKGGRPYMPGDVRISFGLYNTKGEIDRLLNVLENLVKGDYDLKKYKFDNKIGYYTAKYRRRLDDSIQEAEEQVFGTAYKSLCHLDDENKKTWGNKGSKYGIFNRLKIKYPPGFVINTGISKRIDNLEALTNPFWVQIENQIKLLETKTGKIFGNKQNPLLLAIRSSPEFSMPAILHSFLNVGINDEVAENLAERYGEFYAYDTYRRFIEQYGILVLKLPKEDFDDIFQRTKGMKNIVDEYKRHISAKGHSIPSDVWVQLRESAKAVIDSWSTPRAKMFMVGEDIPQNAGFSIIIQQMIFGNLNKHSAAGVLFTRNPNNGNNELFGNYLTEAQGEDIVSGRLRGKPIHTLEIEFPEIFRQLIQIKKHLELSQYWPQEIEFVIEDGRLYILQTRDIEFAATVLEEVLTQLEKENITNRYQAVSRIEKWQARKKKRKIFKINKKVAPQYLLNGVCSTPGAIIGKLAFNIDKALEYSMAGDPVILLLTPESSGILRNIFNIPMLGLLTTYGNESFHEAVLCRLAGIPAIVNIEGVDYKNKNIKYRRGVINEGDIIVLDGDNNRVFIPESTDILEEIDSLLDISFGIDIAEYAGWFLSTYYQPRTTQLKNGFDYQTLIELNIVYREKFLHLEQDLQKDPENPALRKASFVANLEKHLLHQLLYQAAKLLGKSVDEVNKELNQIIRLVDMGKIFHQIGDFILFEQKVIGDTNERNAITLAEEIILKTPGAELKVEKLDDRFGAKLVSVILRGEAEILYHDEYLYTPYNDDRDNDLKKKRDEARLIQDAFPGARLIERNFVTYIHSGGGTEINYHFIVYRRKDNLSSHKLTDDLEKQGHGLAELQTSS